MLREEYQVRPNGVKRARNVLLSEKMKADASWQTAVLRAVQEELGSILPSNPQASCWPANGDRMLHANVSYTSQQDMKYDLMCFTPSNAYMPARTHIRVS